jgi:hypothetical protein
MLFAPCEYGHSSITTEHIFKAQRSLFAILRRFDCQLHKSYVSELGNLLHLRRNEALVFKKNAGKFVGNFNYRSLHPITRRADLLFAAYSGMNPSQIADISDYVQRVLSINIHAGEKSIPSEVKQRFPFIPAIPRVQATIFGYVDQDIRQVFGWSEEELNAFVGQESNSTEGNYSD